MHSFSFVLLRLNQESEQRKESAFRSLQSWPITFVSKKQLYKYLRDVMLPVPVYRNNFSVGAGKDVLKRVKRMPVRSSVKSFFFLLHTGTLPVKPWLQEKGFLFPGQLTAFYAESLKHYSIYSWTVMIFHWDILQRTLKKDLPLTTYGIHFLPVNNDGGVPYDMFMVLSLHSIWKTRMAFKHAEPVVRSVRENFIESIAYMRDVYLSQDEQPTWFPVLNDLVSLKLF